MKKKAQKLLGLDVDGKVGHESWTELLTGMK